MILFRTKNFSRLIKFEIHGIIDDRAYIFRRIQSNQGIKVEKKVNRALGNQFWGFKLDVRIHTLSVGCVGISWCEQGAVTVDDSVPGVCGAYCPTVRHPNNRQFIHVTSSSSSSSPAMRQHLQPVAARNNRQQQRGSSTNRPVQRQQQSVSK